ncbi:MULTISPECIES: DUF2165 family protein [unclassified Herbaspirillum]|uniref:DUF2165 family protein n=1 Tax=unclassified Herbaspirillum TaxID=2624150 RepID=UPI000E2E9526|nr:MULTISPECIES: DUF2165 family protein [unclassified Herbaspirillum]RFB70846.1 DUF2165 family protein [Herbaspirillum sp. 3R-3a1]TFI08629.1 DUF2165 family protein [Herbaspirillum sp. 3R11]TFI15044.1 DUF2165 family protein [Herbaspirillum sp. 3R-11]TFI29767.1 DUF2165 family protein [Herbaspirillum sp. 3C11]
MSLHSSLWLFQSVYAVGLATWLTIAVIDNLRGFRELVHVVGITMSMAPLKRSPVIHSILSERAVTSVHWHRLAVLLLLTLKLVAAITCWTGCYELLIGAGLNHALPWLNIALSAFTTLLFAMHLAGLWFAYWIREDDLQRGHLALLIWTLAAFFLFNGHWA